MTAHAFVDLGRGWYLTEDGVGEQYVADSRSTEPDHVYGPAAWRGLAGPRSGRTLIRLKYVGRDAYLAAMDEHEYENGPHPGECPLWPANIDITEAGVNAGLPPNPTTCASIADLVTSIEQHVAMRHDARLAIASQQSRLEIAEHIHAGLNGSRQDLH